MLDTAYIWGYANMRAILTFLTAIFASSAMGQTPEQFIVAALEGLSLQTSAHNSTWQLGEAEQWSVDLDAGIIEFDYADGKKVTAPIQVIGTYNQLDGTFLWGWDHPSVPLALRKHAALAKQWGIKNKVTNFMSRKVSCSEEDAWGFAAVANRLAKANGVYRGPSGTTLVFMTFGEIKIKKHKP